MDSCIYNTGGFCYKDNTEDPKECQHLGDEENCEDAEEDF